MAKTVTQNFLDVWARKGGKQTKVQVRYKRRYWNGSAYVYEVSWQVLEQRDFADIGEIVLQLDTPFLSTFKQTDITLRLNNTFNEWIPAETSPSVFAKDPIATLGYDPPLTQFQIKFGYVLDDGSTEYIDLFTGVATDFIFEGLDGAVEAVIASKAHLLHAADASKVSDTFTNEACSPAAADGVETEFRTGSTGVGRISGFRVDAITQKQGSDYTISGLNRPGKTALITAEVAPATGAVDASGLKWKENKSIEELVGLLCDEGGITAPQRTIETVIFPGGLDGFKKVATQTDWENGTLLQNIDTKRDQHSIRAPWILIDDFTDGDFTANPPWINQPFSPGGTATETIIAGVFHLDAPAHGDSASLYLDGLGTFSAFGMWSFDFKSTGTGAGFFDTFAEFKFISDAKEFGQEGYAIRHDHKANKALLVRVFAARTTILDMGAVPVGPLKYRITRTSAGLFEVFQNGVSKGTVVDLTYTVASHMLYSIANNLGNINCDLDNIYHAPILNPDNVSITGVFESEEFDILFPPISWGALVPTHTLNGGTITYKTAVASSAGGPYDAWTALGGGDVIQSALKQYLKIQATIDSVDINDPITLPKIDKIVANFRVDRVFVSLAIFAGKTAYQAIERYAQIADYEMGFEGDGKFFFRAKPTAAASILSINQENAIAEIADYHPGYDRVINVGQVQYGDYYNEYDGADASEASPTSEERFGRLIRYIDFSDVLLANDVDLATGHAQLIYERNFRAKRRFRIRGKLIAWADLSDILTVTYFDHPLLAGTVWGDPLAGWGGIAPFSPAKNVLANGLEVKILGLVLVPREHECDIICEERLS